MRSNLLKSNKTQNFIQTIPDDPSFISEDLKIYGINIKFLKNILRKF